MLVFPLLFAVLSSALGPSYAQPRHMVVIYPLLCVIAAHGITRATDWLGNQRQWWPGRQSALTVTATLLVAAPVAYETIRHDVQQIRPHSHTLAKAWVEANLLPTDTLLVEDVNLPPSPNRAHYEALLHRARATAASQFTTHAEPMYEYLLKALPSRTFDITYLPYPWWQKEEKRAGVHPLVMYS